MPGRTGWLVGWWFGWLVVVVVVVMMMVAAVVVVATPTTLSTNLLAFSVGKTAVRHEVAVVVLDRGSAAHQPAGVARLLTPSVGKAAVRHNVAGFVSDLGNAKARQVQYLSGLARIPRKQYGKHEVTILQDCQNIIVICVWCWRVASRR